MVELDLFAAAAGFTAVELIGETVPRTRATLTNCGNCWSGSAASVTTASPAALENLASGPHALILYQAIDEVGEVGIQIN